MKSTEVGEFENGGCEEATESTRERCHDDIER